MEIVVFVQDFKLQASTLSETEEGDSSLPLTGGLTLRDYSSLPVSLSPHFLPALGLRIPLHVALSAHRLACCLLAVCLPSTPSACCPCCLHAVHTVCVLSTPSACCPHCLHAVHTICMLSTPSACCPHCLHASVATAQANVFAILGNKIVKNLKIFVEVDYLRSRGVLCQPQAIRSLVPELFDWLKIGC